MTLQEILNAHRGHMEKEMNRWRMVRWLGAAIYNAPRGKDDPIVNPGDLMKLPGDGGATSFESEIDRLKEMRKWRVDGQH